MVTCSAVLLEQLQCSYLLYSLHGSKGVRTLWDEDTPGDDVDFDQDLANLWSCIHFDQDLAKTFAARVTAEEEKSIWTQILVIPDDEGGEHVEDDAANLEAVLDPEEGEDGEVGEGEGEAAPVDEELAGEDAPPAQEGGEAPTEDVEL